MIVSASVHFYKYWSYSALFCCCCRCGVVVLDNCATENCTFNSNMIRHHFAHARSTERCSHLPFGRKILEGLLCFFSFPEWMLRYYNNKNIFFARNARARAQKRRPKWALFPMVLESFAMLIKRNGPIIYFYIFEGSFKNETELKNQNYFYIQLIANIICIKTNKNRYLQWTAVSSIKNKNHQENLWS